MADIPPNVWPPCPGCGAETDSTDLPRGSWMYHQAPPPNGWPHLGVPAFAIILVLTEPLDPAIKPFLAGPVVAHMCLKEQQRRVVDEVVAEAEAILEAT